MPLLYEIHVEVHAPADTTVADHDHDRIEKELMGDLAPSARSWVSASGLPFEVVVSR